MTLLIRYNKEKKIGVYYDKKQFVKFYTNFNSKTKKLIKNEYAGFNWYLTRLKKKKYINNFKISKINSCIKTDAIHGVQLNYWDNFSNQVLKINKVIEHYKSVWPNKKFVPYHGDLTIENIIFNKNKNPIVIDWEHFKKKEYWGLDLSYFLISILILPIIVDPKKKINNKEILIVKKIWKNLFYKKKFLFLKNPIKYIKKINKNKNNFFKRISPALESKIKEIYI